MCRDLLQPRSTAQRPYAPINANAIKAECSIRLPKAAKTLLKIHPQVRLPLATMIKDPVGQAPRKPKTPQGAKTPFSRNQMTQNRGLGWGITVKCPYESVAGAGAAAGAGAGAGVPSSANGGPLASGIRSSSQPAAKHQKLNSADAPNSVVFVATKDNRVFKEALTHPEMRRAARRPSLPLMVKTALSTVRPPVPLPNLHILPAPMSPSSWRIEHLRGREVG